MTKRNYEFYIGVDLHLETSVACVCDRDGNPEKVVKLYNKERDQLKDFFEKYRENGLVVVEATGYTLWFIGFLDILNVSRLIADPYPLKSNAPKSDRIDARKLAKLGRLGEVPEAYIAQGKEEELRSLTRLHKDLVYKKTKTIQQLKALLRWHGLNHGESLNLNTKCCREELLQLDVSAAVKFEIRIRISEIESLIDKIAQVKKEISKRVHERYGYQILLDIKGFGDIFTATILGESGDIKRFYSARHYASYAGLVPRVSQSGDTARIGSLSKRRNARLQSALIEASWSLVAHDSRIREKYRYYRDKKGKKAGKAIVIIANRLAKSLFHCLMTGEVFDPVVAFGLPKETESERFAQESPSPLEKRSGKKKMSIGK